MCCLLLSLHTADYWVQEPVTHSTGRKLSLWSQSADRLLTEFLCTLSGPKILQLCVYSEFLQARAPTKELTLQISNQTDLITYKIDLFLLCAEKTLWTIYYIKKQ